MVLCLFSSVQLLHEEPAADSNVCSSLRPAGLPSRHLAFRECDVMGGATSDVPTAALSANEFCSSVSDGVMLSGTSGAARLIAGDGPIAKAPEANWLAPANSFL